MNRVLERALAIAEERFITASGPGGQNVNKVASAVQLRVDASALGLAPRVLNRLALRAGSRLSRAGEIVIDARNHRTQEANRREARMRLAALIEDALEEPKARAMSRVNRIGKTKRLAAKKEQGAKKALRGRVDW